MEVKSEYRQFVSKVLQEVMKICNYAELVKDPNFLTCLERIDPVNRSAVKAQILAFFKCSRCGYRIRVFEDGGTVCFNCPNASEEHAEELNSDFKKIDCLKCFTLYSIDSFSASFCKHMCGFCVSKEVNKGRLACKFCSQEFEDPVALMACRKCGVNKGYFEMFEMRCGCKYCSDCFIGLKKVLRCEFCNGVNLLISELLEVRQRKMEICLICDEFKALTEFPNSLCCFLDICNQCYLEGSNCPGCKFSKR